MEFIGKTIEDAISTALEVLSITKEEAEITIIEEPTKGLFGRLKGKAVVSVEKKSVKEKEKVKEVKEKKALREQNDEPVNEKTVEFVQKIVDFLGMNASVTLGEKNEIKLEATESSSLIGYRGEVLDAIQTLAGAVENIGKNTYKKVVVDCENYREKREDTLVKLAHRLEQKATEIRREVILEPMNPFERRIIHTALATSQTVTTKSDGKEPNRYVVIVPNDKDEFSKPYNAGRNNKSFGDRRRGGDRRNNRGGRREKRSSGFTETRKKPSMSFGTYLGNSLKDKD